MKITAAISKPSDVNLTITATMSLDQWVAISDALIRAHGEYSHGANELVDAIRNIVYQVKDTFTAATPPPT